MKTQVLIFLKDNTVYYTSVNLENPVYTSLLNGCEPDRFYKFSAGKFATSFEAKDTIHCEGVYFKGGDIQKVLLEPRDADI